MVYEKKSTNFGVRLSFRRSPYGVQCTQPGAQRPATVGHQGMAGKEVVGHAYPE